MGLWRPLELVATRRSAMRRLCTMGCGVILALVLAVAVARSAEPGVRELRFEPVDAQRSGRAVPVKVYMPDAITSPTPVVLFSHGLGGFARGRRVSGATLGGGGIRGRLHAAPR